MKIEPEEYWGFYSTEDGGDFQGVGNAIIMGQLVEAYKKDQRNDQREKTENTPVAGIKRLKLMHNMIEDLLAKIRNEGIIREDADRI